MGHLDPFLQDLNGIGIIAMMVGISAVIVRVVFCKNHSGTESIRAWGVNIRDRHVAGY